MAMYEFRLLDANGKVSTTSQRECATVQEAINLGLTFAAEHHFVEVWADGRAIMRIPRQ